MDIEMESANSTFDLNNETTNFTWYTTGNASGTTEESHISNAMRIGISAYYCFIIVASVTCNTILIAIIARCRQLHTMSHLFIVNLAVSNLLTSLLYVPFDVEKHLRGDFFPHGKFLCGIYQLSFMLSLPLSTINLLLLTLESFITIAYPYKRGRFVNKRTVTVTLVCAYLYAVTYTLFPVLRHQEDSVVVNETAGICYVKFSLSYIYYFVIINLFVPLAVMIVLNLIIFNIANNHTKQITSFHTVTGIIDRPLFTPTTLRTDAAYTTMMQPSEVFLSDSNLPPPSANKGRRISFNPDTLPNVGRSGKRNSFSSEKSNISQARRESMLSQTSASLLNQKRHSLVSHNSSMSSADNSPSEEDALTSSMIPNKDKRKNSSLSTTFVCNIKAAKRIALLVGECIFCWLFYIIVVFINISGKWKDPTWNRLLTQIGMMINCSTLFLNPLVYGLLNPKVRAAVVKTWGFLFRCCRRERALSSSYATSESGSSRRRMSTQSQAEAVMKKFTFR